MILDHEEASPSPEHETYVEGVQLDGSEYRACTEHNRRLTGTEMVRQLHFRVL